MAGTTVAKLNFQYTADATGFMNVTKGIEDRISGLTSRVSSIATGIAAAFATSKIVQGLSFGVKLASEAEQASVAFEVMTGSAETAANMLKELQAFSVVTPFTSSDLRQATQTMLQYGVEQEQVIGIVKQLGDTSAGSAEKLQLQALAFAQIAAMGRLQGGELRQLINAGWNPLQQIAERTGETMTELKARMEAGGISIDEVKQALTDATSEGGRFFGMTEKGSQTLAGRFSTLQENAELLARGIGEVLTPTMLKLIDTGIAATDMLRGMDLETAKNIAAGVAFAATFTTIMLIFPRMITAINSLIVAYRSMTIASIIMQAVTNPASLVRVAAALGIAAAAAVGVKAAFDGLTDANKEAAKTAQAAADSAVNTVDKIGDVGNAAANATRAAANATSSAVAGMESEVEGLKKQLDELKNKGEQARDAIRSQNQFTAAAERFTAAGFQAVFKGDANNAIQKAIEKQTEEERRNTARLESRIKQLETAIKANKITVKESGLP